MEDLKINVAGFNKNSITDGPGIRFVIYAQGCVHNCAGCHNPQTHSFNTGEDYTISQLMDMIKKDPLVKGVTFSGGDPFCQPKAFAVLAKELKQSGYEICSFTGYLFEQITSDKTDEKYNLFKQLDVLIDGPFMQDKKSLDLKFKGSSNQRTIDVQKSLLENSVQLCTSPRWV